MKGGIWAFTLGLLFSCIWAAQNTKKMPLVLRDDTKATAPLDTDTGYCMFSRRRATDPYSLVTTNIQQALSSGNLESVHAPTKSGQHFFDVTQLVVKNSLIRTTPQKLKLKPIETKMIKFSKGKNPFASLVLSTLFLFYIIV